MIDFKSLSTGQKLSLFTVSGLIFALAGYLIYLLVNPAQVMIYQDPSLEQLSKVTSELEQQGIEYQLDENGTGVLVNDNAANKIKVKLAGASAAQTPRAGFELFDNVDYSMTEQAQKITYQRALQGELERTLTAYTEVEQARVHIMIPTRKLFSIEQGQAKASVSLIMVPGAQLSEAKISGIQSLVAASVEGLSDTNVVVLNGEGIKISNNDAADTVPGKPQTKGQLALEEQLTHKAMNLMLLYFNSDQVAVSVSVELDHTQTKQIKKELLGDSEERGYITRKKESYSHRKATKDEPKPAPNKQSETEFNHGHNTLERLSYAGAIKKLNVAIAIVADINDAQRDKLRDLISAGLGINFVRGDQLSVESFRPKPSKYQAVTTVTEPPAEQQAPQVVFEPQAHETNALALEEMTLLAVVLVVALLALILLASLFRGKRLNQAQKEAALLQFNEWVNQSKAGQNAG